MVYGYARVSTIGQARDGNSIEAQVCALKQAGAVKIFKDVFSGKSEHRPQLNKLLKVIQSSDKLIITKLDRMPVVSLKECNCWRLSVRRASSLKC